MRQAGNHVEKDPIQSFEVPTLGVVIPVYNRESLVLETLESVRAQTTAPDKVIIIDDGSQDDSYAAVNRWLDQHQLDRQQWLLIHQANTGLSGARNAARPHTTDIDLVVFLDSDDLWPNDMVGRAKAFFQTHPDYAAASADGEKLYIDEQGNITTRELLPIEPANNPFTLLKNRSPLVCATFFSRKVLDTVGWFDARVKYAEDHLLWHLVATQGAWGYLEGAPFQYRYFHNPSQPHNSAIPRLSSRLRCARELADGLKQFASTEQLRDPDLRWAIWRTWYAVARACDKAGKRRIARRLYWEAIKANPVKLKSLLRFFRCCP